MRYLRVVEERGRYVASLSEAPAPTPARGEVLIRVTASGVNRADLSQIAGRYPPPPGGSEVLGLEVSGTLDEAGGRARGAGGARRPSAGATRGGRRPRAGARGVSGTGAGSWSIPLCRGPRRRSTAPC